MRYFRYVNELYYFFGNKTEIQNFHEIISENEFHDFGCIIEVYDIDATGCSFKVELETYWNSKSHDIEEKLKELNFNISFYMASNNGMELWCFSDDIERKYISEEYFILELPFVDDDDQENPIIKLTHRHFYTSLELKNIFDEFYGKNEPIEYYLDYFNEVNKYYIPDNGPQYNNPSPYNNSPETFTIKIQKLKLGTKEENLLCTYDKELIEELNSSVDPDELFYVPIGMHDEIYVKQWLHKYNKNLLSTNFKWNINV